MPQLPDLKPSRDISIEGVRQIRSRRRPGEKFERIAIEIDLYSYRNPDIKLDVEEVLKEVLRLLRDAEEG